MTGDRSARHKSSRLLAALLLIPAAIFIGRLPALPTSRWLNEVLSLSALPPGMHRHAEFVLFVPLSAIVVSFFRLTLGLPVLSFFRPILTAIGFRIIGIPWGMAFLAAALSGVVLVKPLLKDAHYYVRVPLLLSLTAIFLVVPMLLHERWHLEMFRQFAYFPSICLALICEGFTKILNDKGLRAALWPTVNMIASAAVITLIADIPGVLNLLLGYPEVLLLQGGLIVAISKYLDLELFAERNPFMPKALSARAAAPSMPPPAVKLRSVGER
jgi:7 transmembrane helices usually fused to an inactive transglutaminase